ncbi:MAG: DoxX family protein [Thermoflexibacter sp.]|jgi:putative oxidoreductase|nr:DoxX family protein [Thermoflexibacter sp.]
MKLPNFSDKYPLLVLRILLGIIFITHGAARLYYWSIPDFTSFFEKKGIPFGIVWVWLVTLGEIVSGSLLATGFFVRYCLLFHTVIIVLGIFLVHIHLGWFVVGLGGGGVEYSLLILAVMAVLYSKAKK